MPENSYNPQSRPANGKSSGNAGCIGCLIPFFIMFIIFMIAPVFTLFDVTGPIPPDTREFILSFTVGFAVLLVAVISVIAAVRRKSREISRNQPGPGPTVPSVKPQPYQIQSNWSRTMQNKLAQSPQASGQTRIRTSQNLSQQRPYSSRTVQNIYSTTCPDCGVFLQIPRGTTQRCRTCGRPVTAPVKDKPFFS